MLVVVHEQIVRDAASKIGQARSAERDEAERVNSNETLLFMKPRISL